MSQCQATSCMSLHAYLNIKPHIGTVGSHCVNSAFSLLSQMVGDHYFFCIDNFLFKFSTDCEKIKEKSM